MMEEIDLFSQETPANSSEGNPKHASASSGISSAAPTHSTHNDAPLRLPRTTGSSRGTFLRDTIQSQIPTTEQLQKRKQQAGKMFKTLGNQFNKINLGKLIDKMEQDQGLADSLEQLNSRMKEEVERHEIRREAEQLTLKVIVDHLNKFLVDNPSGTYEEWIQDLHPENANQGQLLSDIQQIDERFYVMESDHRRLWNEAIHEQEKEKHGDTVDETTYVHRLVEARTQIWGKAPGTVANDPSQPSHGLESDATPTNHNPVIDLLSGSNVLNSNAPNAPVVDNGIEEIDFFAPAPNSTTDAVDTVGNKNWESAQSSGKNSDPFQDLIQF